MHSLEELSAMTVFQRLKVADWRLEVFTLVFCIVFVAAFKAGDIYNTSKVTGFLNGVKAVLDDNFAQVGVSDGKLYEKDSAENFASYASGRDNIAKVNMNFRLAPRQNVFVWAMEAAFSMFSEAVPAPEDRVDIYVTPSIDYENFITAVVSKLGMSQYRKFSYYLSLTKTTDSAQLPESFVFMSEATEFQEKTFTAKLAKAFNTSMASYVRFLAFTDQPAEKPEAIRDLAPRRRVVLSLKLVSGKKQMEEVSELLAAVFDIVDQIADGQITFRTEAAKKVVKAREAEISKIKRAEEAVKAEALAEEKAQLKRKERDALRSKSREEQLKAEKKANEKKQKKAQKKMKVRQ